MEFSREKNSLFGIATLFFYIGLGTKFEKGVVWTLKFLERRLVPGKIDWTFGYRIKFRSKFTKYRIKVSLIHKTTASYGFISENFSKIKFLFSKFEAALLKCWIRSFSESIYNFYFKFFRISIFYDAYGTSSGFCSSLAQVYITTRSNSKSENFSIIVLCTHLFTVINNLSFITNLTVS